MIELIINTEELDEIKEIEILNQDEVDKLIEKIFNTKMKEVIS